MSHAREYSNKKPMIFAFLFMLAIFITIIIDDNNRFICNAVTYIHHLFNFFQNFYISLQDIIFFVLSLQNYETVNYNTIVLIVGLMMLFLTFQIVTFSLKNTQIIIENNSYHFQKFIFLNSEKAIIPYSDNTN